MANINFEVIVRMFFLKINNANVAFGKKTHMWKFYTTNKVFFTTAWVQIIDKTDFVIMALDIDNKTFVVYVTIWEQEKIAMNPIKKAKIKVQSRT